MFVQDRHSPTFTLIATVTSLLAFAGNSLLCRLSLRPGGIDPATFTGIRLISGAMVLLALVVARRRPAGGPRWSGSWRGALALAGYAAGFSWAYVGMTAGTGALLLFGAVQATMLIGAVARGERPRGWEWIGLGLAGLGLIILVAPGLAPPPLINALAMIGAGLAWGMYSLWGRGTADPTGATAGNFLRASLLVLPWLLLGSEFTGAVGTWETWPWRVWLWASISGGLTSGLGYVVWYWALRGLTATRAALVQLSVPLLAAAGGILWLGEPLRPTLLVSALLVVGGMALAILARGYRR